MQALAARLPDRHLIGQLVRYGVTGVTSLGVYIGLLVVLERHLAVPVLVANFLGYAAATGANYILNHHWTFASAAKHREAGVKFMAVVALGVALNSLFVALLTGQGVSAQLAGIAFVALWPLVSFAALRLWAFKG